MLKDEGVLIFFIVVPIVYPLLYSWIYNNEAVHEVCTLRSQLRLVRDLRPGASTANASIWAEWRHAVGGVFEHAHDLRPRKARAVADELDFHGIARDGAVHEHRLARREPSHAGRSICKRIDAHGFCHCNHLLNTTFQHDSR